MIDEVSAMEELERRRMYGKPPARQPQHCDHECVCGEFKMNPIFGSGVPCSRNHEGCHECINDTRTHTSPQAAAADKCCIGLTYEQCQEVSVREKSEAAKAAREQDIKILEDYRISLDYPNCPPGDTIKRLVESLRQPEPQQ